MDPTLEISISVRFAATGEHFTSLLILPSESVQALRHAIENAGRLAGDQDMHSQYRLLLGAKLLVDTDTLDAVGIGDGTVIDIVRCCGHRVITASLDGTARIWKAEEGECVQVLADHGSGVKGVAVSPDKCMVLTRSSHLVKLWNCKTGVCMTTIEVNGCCSAVFSPEGAEVLLSSDDPHVTLWSVETGECLQQFFGWQHRMRLAIFSPDGSVILTACRVDTDLDTPADDDFAKTWTTKTATVIQTFAGHLSWLTSVSFSPDGLSVLTSSDDRTAKIWYSQTGACKHTFDGHHAAVLSAVFSPSGDLVLTTSADALAKMWSADTGECVRTFTGQSALFCLGGASVLTAGGHRNAKLWSASTGECERTFSGHTGVVGVAVMSADGEVVLTASNHGTARLWCVATGEFLQMLLGHEKGLMACEFL